MTGDTAGTANNPKNRLKQLEELLSEANVESAICLDASYKATDPPPGLGLEEIFGSEAGYLSDLYLQAVDIEDHGRIASAVITASRQGVSGCLVRLSEVMGDRSGQQIQVRVVDLLQSDGVTLILIGQFQDLDQLESDDVLGEPLPRMLKHRTNEFGGYITVDSQAHRLLGWSSEELMGQPGLELIHSDDRDRVVEAWLKTLGNQDSGRTRCRTLCKNGSWRWFELTYQNFLNNEDGGYVEVESLDVDDEMQALAQVRHGASQFETLTKTLPVGVVQIDLQGQLVFANRWVRQLVQLSEEVGQSNLLVESVHIDDRGMLLESITRSLAGESMDFELRIHAYGDDEIRRCSVRSRPLVADEEIFGVIASLEDITESVSLQDRLRLQATTDHLTGLPNRAALAGELQKLLSSNSVMDTMACLFIDLDGFKLVNDALGHDAGDHLLEVISTRLTEALRPGDVVARVGGDEFVVLCPWEADEAAVIQLARRLMDAVERSVSIDGVSAHVGASVGIALHNSRTGGDVTADVIIGNADMAMYEAKRAGGSRWSIYGEELRQVMHHRFDLQRSMHEAINKNEFVLHLQPVWDLVENRVVGAEALIRWNHPDKGLVFPGYFIDYAAESDLMVPLGWWIINDACRIAAQIVNQGDPNFRMGVNVTGGQLTEPGFSDKFLDTVSKHGLEPRNLMLEVTETVWIDDGPLVSSTLETLNEAGVEIALDDFGTGYSSLNHVRDMPVNLLKIDYSYTSKVETCSATLAIVESIRDLAAKLGLAVVVEGIETTEQREIIADMGLRFAQGFLMARPCDEQTFLQTYVTVTESSKN